jgi:hypothetical protein
MGWRKKSGVFAAAVLSNVLRVIGSYSTDCAAPRGPRVTPAPVVLVVHDRGSRVAGTINGGVELEGLGSTSLTADGAEYLCVEARALFPSKALRPRRSAKL